MRKKLVFLMFSAIILTGLVIASDGVHKVAAAPYQIIHINADGSITPETPEITSSDNVTYTFTADINASIVVGRNNIVVDGAGYTVQGLGNGTGIDLSGRNNVTLKNAVVTNFTYGIYGSYFSNNNIVTGNTVSNNDYGIYLYYSSNNNIVADNNASNNHAGIQLYSSNHNTVTGNNASNNSDSGFYLDYSSNNFLYGNTVSDNNIGIYPDSSSHNILAGNTVSNNGYVGFYLHNSSNNILAGNTVSNHSYSGGIGLYSSSKNSLIYNNFIDNAKQVAVSPDDVNAWDNSIEGNYWSNYTGVDSNHDGIGDTPHVTNANNTDYRPLMGMFHSFNTSLGTPVNITSNSTVDSFQYELPGTIRFRVSNTTANQAHGFCRVSIPYDVLSPPFNVTIDGANPTYWNYTLCDNGASRWIYFEYEHSTREVVIVPEFPSVFILPLFMALSLLVAIAYRRRHAFKT